MKNSFAGLLLFLFLAGHAQNPVSKPVASNSLLLPRQKLVTLVWAQQGTDQAVFYRPRLTYPPAIPAVPLEWWKQAVVQQKVSPFAEGLAYGLLLARSFTRFSDVPNNVDGMNRYYRINAYLAGKQNTDVLFGRDASAWPFRQ